MTKGYLKVIILKELCCDRLTGYDLMKRVESFTGKRPSPGSIYPVLNDLLKSGYIRCMEKERKKIYSITAKGRIRVGLLFREKRNLLIRNIQVIREFGSLAGEEYVRPLLVYLETLRTSPHVALRAMKIVPILQQTLLKLLSRDDYNDLEPKVMGILEKTVKELEALNKASTKTARPAKTSGRSGSKMVRPGSMRTKPDPMMVRSGSMRTKAGRWK